MSPLLPRARSALGRLRHPLRLTGHLLIVRQLESNFRFKSTERFDYEIPERRDFFRRAFHYLSFNCIEGDYAEFGSYTGYTFRLAWGAANMEQHLAHLWAFDSFEGLPEGRDDRDRHPRWVPGTLVITIDEFHGLCRKAGIPQSRYSAVAGYYSSTLRPDVAGSRPERISFAYVDCDLFSSTVEVLAFLDERLVPGAILAFDDFYCDGPGGPAGERLASKEHFGLGGASRWNLVPYIQYGWSGMSFIVECRRTAAGDADTTRPSAEARTQE